MTSSTPKRIFITGATGHIGTALTSLALSHSHTVRALSRTPASDAALLALGATPVRGDLTTLTTLRSESSAADTVLHLATAYTFGQGTYESVRAIDTAALDAIAAALAGTDKPLVVTSGTLVVTADPSGRETTESSHAEVNPLNTRLLTEQHALQLAARGIRVTALRVPPYVYGHGRSGVAQFMDTFAHAGVVSVIDSGHNRTTAAHVDDVAALYLLAAERGRAGEVYNAGVSTDVTMRELSEAMADVLGLAVRDLSKDEASEQFGPGLTYFLSVENRASGGKAMRELGWKPKELGILEDIRTGSYVDVAQGLKK
ncbi:Uncharacterized protein CTRI78_v000246 [Colletotrichum trifolii]|uniref:NAD-dependent epimerase/dehydratase domain-containing protein n=1 Tax=Colletotrichum trifolii TaxID=5466 RepID=A0A4R8RYL7_COLTR|nr:Uncharacterized protein CTRI78_v000246 [Colletotrichum trifolii]